MKKFLSHQGYIHILRVFTLGAMLAGLLLPGFLVRPAYAAAPGTGIVMEGFSVPGIELGYTRAQVEAAYGEPRSCQSGGVIGNFSTCSFDVEGGGQVSVHYRGADGGEASNSPDDVVHNIRWHQQVSGWTTTAGVDTTLALEDPDAVIAAYPNATVIYNSLFGNIESIEDRTLGILIDYHFDYLSGTLSVSMAIYFPSSEPSPPPVERFLRVTAIDLAVEKRTVTADVKVQDDLDQNVSGATVSATWFLPKGETLSVMGQTDGFGVAHFEINKARKGLYTMYVNDVVLEGFKFDWYGSVVSASIRK
jgi:hypothetical protein